MASALKWPHGYKMEALPGRLVGLTAYPVEDHRHHMVPKVHLIGNGLPLGPVGAPQPYPALPRPTVGGRSTSPTKRGNHESLYGTVVKKSAYPRLLATKSSKI